MHNAMAENEAVIALQFTNIEVSCAFGPSNVRIKTKLLVVGKRYCIQFGPGLEPRMTLKVLLFQFSSSQDWADILLLVSFQFAKCCQYVKIIC